MILLYSYSFSSWKNHFCNYFRMHLGFIVGLVVISSPKVSLGQSGNSPPVYCRMKNIPSRHTVSLVLGNCTLFQVVGLDLLSLLTQIKHLTGMVRTGAKHVCVIACENVFMWSSYLVSIWQEGMSMDHQVLVYLTVIRAKATHQKGIWMYERRVVFIVKKLMEELTFSRRGCESGSS